jgi:hypothetical protein
VTERERITNVIQVNRAVNYFEVGPAHSTGDWLDEQFVGADNRRRDVIEANSARRLHNERLH